jgi:GMP reductase
VRIEQDIKLDYKDVLFKPKRSKLESRRDVDLTRTFKFHNSGNEWTGVPVMASNMDGVGTFAMAKVLQDHKMITVMRRRREGNAPDYATMKAVLAMYPDIKFITVDVANAYHENYADFIARLRDEYPDKTIIAGNVISAEMTEELIIKGADIVKCGIGPGSVCTTRTMTGVGVPQLSGIIECADAANGIGGHIIADGGCVFPGDVSKAFGAGAHFVMLGGMLAGHDESEGKVVNGKIQFYGMSSNAAMAVHGTRKDGYRGAEGKVVELPHKGPVDATVVEILGGLRSTATYIGAKRIKDMPKCTTFVRVTQQVNQVFNQYNA